MWMYKCVSNFGFRAGPSEPMASAISLGRNLSFVGALWPFYCLGC